MFIADLVCVDSRGLLWALLRGLPGACLRICRHASDSAACGNMQKHGAEQRKSSIELSIKSSGQLPVLKSNLGS